MLFSLVTVLGGAYLLEAVLSDNEEDEAFGSVSRTMGGRGDPSLGVSGWMGGRVMASPYASTETSRVASPWSWERSGSAPGSRFGATGEGCECRGSGPCQCPGKPTPRHGG